MNKKFSTLLVSALLAGAVGANAQTTPVTSITKGNVYYLVASGTTFTGVKADGSTLATNIASTALSTREQWQVTAEINLNGTKNYVLTNVETGKVLSYTGAGTLTLGGDNKYASLTDASIGQITYGSSNVYLKEIDPIPSNLVALNNNQGWRKGFGLQVATADHEDVLAVESNVFTGNTIVAYSATALNEIPSTRVNPTATGDPVNKLQKGLNLNNHFVLKVSGDWKGEDLFDYKYVNGTQKWVLNADVLAKFRASQFIVLDKDVYSTFATNVDGQNTKGYKFTTVYGAQLVAKYADANWEGNNWDATVETSVSHHIMDMVFDIKQDPTVPACANDVLISLPQTWVWYYDTTAKKYTYKLAQDATTGTNIPAYVSIFNFEGKQYLASSNVEKEAIDSHITLKDNMLVAKKGFVGTIVNLETSNGLSWLAGTTGVNDVISSTYVDKNVPEGQWIVEGKDFKAGVFSFKNREAGTYLFSNYTLYKTSTANVYEAVTSAGDAKVDLVITAAPARADRFDNYANLDEKNFADEVYNIAVSTELFKNVYLAETGLAKTVELTSNEEEAGAWKLSKWTSNKSYEAGIEKADTLFVINNIDYWNPSKKGGANWDTYADTLAMFAYTIQNEAGNYLAYNEVKDAYEVQSEADLKGDAAKFDARKHAPKFIMKEKFGQVNLLDLQNVNFYTKNNAINLNTATDKLYGAFSYNKVSEIGDIYKTVDNDLFTVEIVAAPEYRRLAEDQEMSNIIIFKDENANDVLFEKGDFLGMEHVADYDMAAALFADTAYVRYETRKPQYLLAVRPTQVIDKEECEIEGHPHSQCDTVYGDFLVNLVDTAKAYAAQANKLPNPYIWEGGYKLAFVSGKHTADKLIIDAAKPAAKDTIDLSKNVNKVGTYAFRYVDRASESFIIETSLDGSATPGYIKWLNGTPVVIADATKAEVFNLTATEEEATANEAVEASEVSVVAVNGAIIVKGAAGKVVTVANILGQTIANQVAASDNITIAAPAGIAVVTVDGEATKVVVK